MFFSLEYAGGVLPLHCKLFTYYNFWSLHFSSFEKSLKILLRNSVHSFSWWQTNTSLGLRCFYVFYHVKITVKISCKFNMFWNKTFNKLHHFSVSFPLNLAFELHEIISKIFLGLKGATKL